MQYKSGDIHPSFNQMAFVRYDESGREEWTSVYGDPTAPYRMAQAEVVLGLISQLTVELQTPPPQSWLDEVARTLDGICVRESAQGEKVDGKATSR